MWLLSLLRRPRAKTTAALPPLPAGDGSVAGALFATFLGAAWTAAQSGVALRLPSEAAGRAILGADPETRLAVTISAVDRLLWIYDVKRTAPAWVNERLALEELLPRLFGRTPTYDATDLTRVVARLAQRRNVWHSGFPLAALLQSVQRWSGDRKLPPDLRAALVRLRDRRPESAWTTNNKTYELLDALLGDRRPVKIRFGGDP